MLPQPVIRVLDKLRSDWSVLIVERIRGAKEVRVHPNAYFRLQTEGGLTSKNFEPATTMSRKLLSGWIGPYKVPLILDESMDTGALGVVKGTRTVYLDVQDLDKVNTELSPKRKPERRESQAEDLDKNSVIRVQLDFLMEMDGDQPIPDVFMSGIEEFLATSLQIHKVKARHLLGRAKVKLDIVNLARLTKKRSSS